MKHIEKLKKYLEKCDGKVVDVLYEIYTIFEELDYNEQLQAFQFFCENRKIIKSDGTIKTQKTYFTDKQIETSTNRSIKIDINNKIKSIIDEALLNNYSPDQFYRNLWEYITTNKAFKTKRDKVIALFFVMENELIPYKNIGIGREMDDDTFDNIINHLADKTFEKIDYIFNMEFNQKTQTCSLLLETLLSLNKKDEQIVLLSVLLDKTAERVKEDLKNYIDRI